MIHIEGGTFDMGGKSWDSDSKPIHKVHLSPFWMGKFPVTQALWQTVMGTNPSHFKGANRPVESVSWEDITYFFLPKLNVMTKGQRPDKMNFCYFFGDNTNRTYANGRVGWAISWRIYASNSPCLSS